MVDVTVKRSPAMRWLLWLALMHSVPAPFWLYVVAGMVPAAGLLVGGITGLLLGDWQSLVMGVVLGAQGLGYAVLFYLLAWVLTAFICRVQRPVLRSLLLATLVGALLAGTLAPIYGIYGHGGGETLNIIGLLKGFAKYPFWQHVYLAGFCILLMLLFVLQAARLPRFLLEIVRHAPPTYVVLLLLVGGIALTAVYNHRVRLVCAPAGEAGLVWAQLCVARSLREGPGGPHDRDASGWYERAAEQGSLTAMRELLEINRDLEVRKKWLPILVAEGDNTARYDWWKLIQRDASAHETDKAQARAWLAAAAKDGHADSAMEMGRLLVRTDPAAARIWWEQAAAAGHGDAMRELAWRYAQSTQGFPIDLARAAHLYNQLARGVEKGQFETKMYTLTAAGYSQQAAKIESLLRDAESGDVSAQLQLGQRILDSTNPGDAGYQEAIRWLELAAEQGSVDAQHQLGRLFVFGRKGMEKDFARGRRWWDMAAAQAHVPTLRFVAEARISGKYGYDVDLAEARVGFAVLADAFANGTHGVEADPRSAAHWQSGLSDTERRIASLGDAYQPMGELRELANSGDTDAQYRLGLQLMQAYSREAHQDAVNWWIRAADGGHHQAQFRLVSYFDRGGPYVKKDHARVVELLQRAAAGKHPRAMHTLGLAYEKGRYGLPRDLAKADTLYSEILAAKETNPYGWQEEGRFYSMVASRAKAVERMQNIQKPAE